MLRRLTRDVIAQGKGFIVEEDLYVMCREQDVSQTRSGGVWTSSITR